MKRERKRIRVELVDEDMILLKVPSKGIVEWKVIKVSEDFIEFEYALDDVIFCPGEWNECRGEYIRNYVLDPKKQKIWHATVAYPSALIDLKCKRPFVFYSHGKLAVTRVCESIYKRNKEHDKKSEDGKNQFYHVRGISFNRLPMQNIRPLVFFALDGGKKTHELKVVEL